MKPAPQRTLRRQGGAALLAAMLTVTLVATFAAAATWQQWRAIEIEAAERERLQAGWILTGALDWARLILREDGRNGGPDHLAEPWAVPLQEARLSTFLAASGGEAMSDADTAFDAFLSGQITDLQSRLNITNLLEGNKVHDESLQAFVRLFELLGLPSSELQRLAENLRFASDTTAANLTGSQAPLLPRRPSQLVWLGLSPATVTALQPYVTLLPARTAINLNTASAEVIYAATPDIEMADAQRLVEARKRTHLRSVGDVQPLAGLSPSLFGNGQHAVSSRFFEVLGMLRLEGTQIEERSVVQRDGQTVTTLWRERIARDPSAETASARRE